MTTPASTTAVARDGTAAPPPWRWLPLGLVYLAQLMLIPVFAIIAENVRQKTRVLARTIAATGVLGLTPRKKAAADPSHPSALHRRPAQARTLLTPGTDA